LIVYREKKVSFPLETDSVTILTEIQNSGLRGTRRKHTGKIGITESRKGGSKIIGYVPIQIINLSLEEVTLSNHMYVGIASPTETCVGSELAKV
jgi:hypothetical protein